METKQTESVLSYLALNAERHPEKVAIIEAEGGKEITYRELWRRVCIGAEFLQENGVGSGRIVCVSAYSTIEFLTTYYAAQLLGAAVVPLEKQLSSDQIEQMKAYFHTELFFGRDCGILTAECEPFKGEFPSVDTIGTIIFTTGTTSQSKGVMLGHRNYFAGADNYVRAVGVQSSDVISVAVPLSHSGGLRHCLATAIAGGTVLLLNGVVFVKNVLDAITRYHATILRLVPTQLSLLIDRGGERFAELRDQIRCITVGSALTPEAEKEKLRIMFPNSRLFVTYGCTECAGFSHFEYSLYPPRPYCVGKAAFHSRFHIVDENGSEIESSKEHPGIVALSGDNMMQGYYDDPEMTSKTIRNGMIITADLGYRDEDGFYYVIGRRDDVIVSGGFKIAPSEVENALLEIEGVADAACIGIEDSLLGMRPKAFVVMKEGTQFDAREIREDLINRLEPYKVPDEANLVSVAKIPRTDGVGKILYRKLREI